MGRGWTFAAIGALVGSLLLTPGALAEERAQPSGWLQVGPVGDLPIVDVHVSPDWPRDRLVLALREGRLIRSRDGGGHWELLPTPEAFTSLELVPSAGNEPVAFGTSRSGRPQTVYRSTTAGSSWQAVLVFPDGAGFSGDQPPELLLSPSFVQDQVAFLRFGQYLYRSADAGASWTGQPISGELRLSPAFGQDGFALMLTQGTALASHDRGLTWTDAGIAADQWLQDVRFSPTFASDHTIFAIARADPSSDDSASSSGVLISADAGATWRTSSDGLTVDDVPYLSVERLIVSPTYAQDHTLYVTSFGPRIERARGLALWPWALFRSVDGASSWQPVSTHIGYPDRDPRVSWALSASFVQDNTLLSTYLGGLLSSRPSGCEGELSHDGGATWTIVDPRWPDRYWGCTMPRLFGAPGQLVGAFRDFGEGGVGWNVWLDREAGPDWFRSPPDVTAPPVAAADGTVFLGTRSGGIWAHGPSAPSSAGSLACPAQPVLGFGRVYATEVWFAGVRVHDVLGCALDAEQVIGIHQSISSGKPVYLLDDDPAHWYVLNDEIRSDIDSAMYSTFPTAQERAYRGPVQHFEGGVMVYTTEESGQHRILVLSGHAAGRLWRAWPDPPPSG